PRVFRRVLQAENGLEHWQLSRLGDRSAPCRRPVLFRYVDEDELDLEADRLLPPTVVLLCRPTPEQLHEWTDGETLLRYWRLLFHGHAARLLQEKCDGTEFAESTRDLALTLGATEFAEIAKVLRDEGYIGRSATNEQTAVAFTALYLELKYFRGNLLKTFFPSLEDFSLVDAWVARHLDADALFRGVRPAHAPEPEVRADSRSDESHDYYWKLSSQADGTARGANNVRTAITYMRAVRVAPAALAAHTAEKARGQIETLVGRMRTALKLPDEEVKQWRDTLVPLLEKSDQGTAPVEAALLFDLQKLCRESERKLYVFDLYETVLSLGQRPMERPLSSVQLVRVANGLQRAAGHVTLARISDEQRVELTRLFHASQERTEHRLREKFRPVLSDAFEDVGLVGRPGPEKVAERKMIDELLDRVAMTGFVSFSNLRDCISRNQLKLADLSDPRAFYRGDPLIRLDRRLGLQLEGVYQRADFYMRGLERISSLAFGTGVGRFLCRNLLVPFGGAFVLLYLAEYFLYHEFHIDATLKPEWTCWPAGLAVIELMNGTRLRWLFGNVGRSVYQAGYIVLVDVPRRIVPWSRLAAALKSWASALLMLYVLRPAVLTGFVWLAAASIVDVHLGIRPTSIVFLMMALFINSRFGYNSAESFAELLELVVHQVRFNLLRRLYGVVHRFF
ncbi:MAG: hypothetical protein ACRDD1_09085, partial [Planctomycetia bacterium]